MKINKATVFGAGVWGSVIAQHLAMGGTKVNLWEYNKDLSGVLSSTRKHPNIPGFTLHENITLKETAADAAAGAELVVFCISSKAIRGFCKELTKILDGKTLPVMSASKGIEDNTYKTTCEVIEEEIPYLKDHVLAFTGPSFALEVARGIPTKILVAGNKTLAEDLAKVLTHDAIVAVPYADRRGAEYGGAIKNVVAIGCGILDGLGEGANTKAALLTEAMQEMNALILSQGGTTDSVYSLAGLGDAILTGMSEISRNRRLGEKLGQGMSLESARAAVGTIAEGADSVASVYHIAKKNGIKTPVINAVWEIVCNGVNAKFLLQSLGFK